MSRATLSPNAPTTHFTWQYSWPLEEDPYIELNFGDGMDESYNMQFATTEFWSLLSSFRLLAGNSVFLRIKCTPWVTASRFLAGNREAELKHTTLYFYFSVFSCLLLTP